VSSHSTYQLGLSSLVILKLARNLGDLCTLRCVFLHGMWQ
jgi:hypothetical protein